MTRSRLAEILVRVIEELVREQHGLGDLETWVDSLGRRGVAPGEARQVMSWLAATVGEESAGAGGARVGSRHGVHVFDRHDSAALSLEAQGLLIELRELGLLDDVQVEEVVERALGRTSGLLEREELGMVVAEVLLDAAANGEAGFTCWDLLRGDEGAIH